MNNKRIWEDWEIDYIKSNFNKLSNKQMADHLGVRLHSFRMQCYAMGLKRMELEYWTVPQKNFLINNYKKFGDKELAEIFNRKWKKNKPWTLKHIEKKRKYLKLKRTKGELKAIKQRHKKHGSYVVGSAKAWKTRGKLPEGTIRYWKTNYCERRFPVIKVNGKFVHWARHTWENEYGAIPKGFNVVFKDQDPHNRKLANLILITNGELAKRNSETSSRGLSDNYVAGMLSHGHPELRQQYIQRPAIIELKRNQLILNRTINDKQKIATPA